MSGPEMIDGVRVFRYPGDQRHTDVTLTFAVGARDETLPTVGVAHMIQHLVMGLARHTPIDVDAEVDLETTVFQASGSSDRVGAFLRTVCAGLAEPPVERIKVEAGVLTAENGSVAHPLAAFLFNSRYGATGPGLAWEEGPGYDGLTAEQVTAFARRWFVRSNAVLQVTGPVPGGLRLPLPDGPLPVHDWSDGRLPPGPFGLTSEISGAAVLLRLPPGDACRVPGRAADILEQRIEEECRHVGGHSYVVDRRSVAVRGGGNDTVAFADAREGADLDVARVVVAALQGLASDRPTADELGLAIARVEEERAGPSGDVGRLWLATMHDLFGLPPVEPADLDRIRAVTPEQVRDCLLEAMPTAVIAVHENAVAELETAGVPLRTACPVVAELPPGRMFKAPVVARALQRAARSAALVLTADGVAARDEDGVHMIRWDEVAGVMREGRVHVLFGRNGCVIPVGAEVFSGSDRVVAEVLRQVDPGLVYDESSYTSKEDR